MLLFYILQKEVNHKGVAYFSKIFRILC